MLVPDAGGIWVGDYPYLNRPEMEALLAEDDELWDILQDEAGIDDEDDDPVDAEDDNMKLDKYDSGEKVPIRRKR